MVPRNVKNVIADLYSTLELVRASSELNTFLAPNCNSTAQSQMSATAQWNNLLIVRIASRKWKSIKHRDPLNSWAIPLFMLRSSATPPPPPPLCAIWLQISVENRIRLTVVVWSYSSCVDQRQKTLTATSEGNAQIWDSKLAEMSACYARNPNPIHKKKKKYF